MPVKSHIVELDESTAATLNERAAERGLSVPQLIAELVDDGSTALKVDAEQITELDRRWAAVQSKGATAPHDKVVRWLETWGTPAFEPWRDQ
jgi:predicted transcriptional regulator